MYVILNEKATELWFIYHSLSHQSNSLIRVIGTLAIYCRCAINNTLTIHCDCAHIIIHPIMV